MPSQFWNDCWENSYKLFHNAQFSAVYSVFGHDLLLLSLLLVCSIAVFQCTQWCFWYYLFYYLLLVVRLKIGCQCFLRICAVTGYTSKSSICPLSSCHHEVGVPQSHCHFRIGVPSVPLQSQSRFSPLSHYHFKVGVCAVPLPPRSDIPTVQPSFRSRCSHCPITILKWVFLLSRYHHEMLFPLSSISKWVFPLSDSHLVVIFLLSTCHLRVVFPNVQLLYRSGFFHCPIAISKSCCRWPIAISKWHFRKIRLLTIN